MLLRTIDFGPCLDATGVRGFSKRGYWFHRIFWFWYDFSGSTLVKKTATLFPTEGNMPLLGPEKGYGPREWKPKSIWITPVSWIRGIVLNAVGLSNPGLDALIANGYMEYSEEPYLISVMPIAKTAEERRIEFGLIVRKIAHVLNLDPRLRDKIGMEINVTCPNAGIDPSKIWREARGYLSIAFSLGIPLIVKLNVLTPVEAVREIASHPGCDAICCSNTIPFGSKIPEHLGKQIPWERLFPKGSPLARFGGGGLSGKYLLPLVSQWVKEVREAGIDKPINAGGGTLHPRDIDTLVAADLKRGRDATFIGSISMLRPWRIKRVIRRAHERLGAD